MTPLKSQGPVGRYSAGYVEPILLKPPVVPSIDAAWLSKWLDSRIGVEGNGTREEGVVPKYASKAPQSVGMLKILITGPTDHSLSVEHTLCNAWKSGEDYTNLPSEVV